MTVATNIYCTLWIYGLLSHPLPSLDYYNDKPHDSIQPFLPYHPCTGDQDCKLTEIRALRRHSPDYLLYSKGWNISEITY